MYCPNCSERYSKGEDFCSNCGWRLGTGTHELARNRKTDKDRSGSLRGGKIFLSFSKWYTVWQPRTGYTLGRL